jgi:ribosomal protein L11 methyltransferase
MRFSKHFCLETLIKTAHSLKQTPLQCCMLKTLTVIAREQDAQALFNTLDELGACGLSLEDADQGTDAEQPIFGEPSAVPNDEPQYWARNKLVAYFDNAQTLAAALTAVQAFEHSVQEVAQQDWVHLTQAQFSPIEITPHLWIVPSWHKQAAAHDLPSDALQIELDPGLAFGTGSHPTTRLCLQWLAQAQLSGKSVLDYGCGSGILAIAAAKLGAGTLVGIDIDPQAIVAANQNAQVNDCAQIAFGTTALLEHDTRRFDVVVANILSNPLKLLASLLAARTQQQLVLSGILERQTGEIAAAYAPWIALSVWRAQEGWVCMAGTAQRL